jgi:LacI family transcriptional regulator
LKDIAKAAGVSDATASLALNGSSLVNARTREKVVALAEAMAYSPNRIAQGLARKKSRTVGLVVPDIESLFYSQIVRHVNDCLGQQGYQLMLAISDNVQAVEQKIISQFLAQPVEAIIISPVNGPAPDLAYYQGLARQRVPVAFLSSYYQEALAPCVMADLKRGTGLLVGHLAGKGCRSISFLTGLPEVTTTRLRVEGFIQGLQANGLEFSEQQLTACPRVDYAAGYARARELLHTGRKVDAILAINDEMALGVLNAAASLGIRVPDELAIAGFDNVLFSSTAFIPITTIDQNIEAMCRMVTQLVIGMIAQPENRLHPPEPLPIRLLDPILVARESTDRRLQQRASNKLNPSSI